MEEENPITELYLNLLKCAIDRDRVNEAHPAFVKIIGQLSPDEAMILHNLKSIKIEVIEYRKINHSDYHVYSVAESNYPDPDLANSTQLSMCLQHLEYLNLIYYNVREGGRFGDHQFVGDLAPFRATAELTQFGQLFVSACAP